MFALENGSCTKPPLRLSDQFILRVVSILNIASSRYEVRLAPIIAVSTWATKAMSALAFSALFSILGGDAKSLQRFILF